MIIITYRSVFCGFAALIFAALSTASAQANISKKIILKAPTSKSATKGPTKPNEVYAATEEDPRAPTVIDTSEPGETTAPAEALMTLAPIMMPVAANFDPVPPARVDSILKRVKLVEVLLKKFGRAYDYRTVSTQDLEKILAQLESAS